MSRTIRITIENFSFSSENAARKARRKERQRQPSISLARLRRDALDRKTWDLLK